MRDEVTRVRSLLEPLANVRLAYVFGSVAAGRGRDASDVDVAVLFAATPVPSELDQLATDLERAVRRGVDLVVLDRVPPVLGHEVVRTGRLVVCRDDRERVGFETGVARRYLDTSHLRRVQYGYLAERVEARRARAS